MSTGVGGVGRTVLERGLGKKHPIAIEAERALGSLSGSKKRGRKKWS